MWTAAILAGGRARRYGGRDKSALVLAGRTILEWQLDALGPLGSPVMIVAARSGPVRLGVPVVADLEPGTGPLGALLTALTVASTDRVLALAADLPFVTTAFLSHLVARDPDADIVVPRSDDGDQPLCAVYGKTCAGPLRSRLDRGLLTLTDFVRDRSHGLRVADVGADELAPFDPDGRLFLNVNTPEDYRRAMAMVARRKRGTAEPDAVPDRPQPAAP